MQVPSFMHLSRYRCAIKFFEIFYLHIDPFEISFANAKGFAQCHHSIALGCMMPISYRDTLCLMMASPVRSTSLSILGPIISLASRYLMRNKSIAILMVILVLLTNIDKNIYYVIICEQKKTIRVSIT